MSTKTSHTRETKQTHRTKDIKEIIPSHIIIKLTKKVKKKKIKSRQRKRMCNITRGAKLIMTVRFLLGMRQVRRQQ